MRPDYRECHAVAPVTSTHAPGEKRSPGDDAAAMQPNSDPGADATVVAVVDPPKPPPTMEQRRAMLTAALAGQRADGWPREHAVVFDVVHAVNVASHADPREAT